MSLALIRRFDAVRAKNDAVGRQVRARLISSSCGLNFLAITSFANKADGLLQKLRVRLGTCALQKLRVRLGTCKTGLSPPVTLCY